MLQLVMLEGRQMRPPACSLFLASVSPACSGKTQIAATMAVTAQLSREDGGASGKAIILDTENAL